MSDIEQKVDKEYLRILSPMYESANIHLQARIADLKKPYNDRDELTTISLPFWTTTHTDVIYEASPLWPSVCHLCCNGGLQDTVKPCIQTLGDFMDMIPESSYELSFKEFLQDLQSTEDSVQEVATKEKLNWKKSTKTVARSHSTGREPFLQKKSERKFFSTAPSEPFGEESIERKRWWKISCVDIPQKITRAGRTNIRSYCLGSQTSSSSNRGLVCSETYGMRPL